MTKKKDSKEGQSLPSYEHRRLFFHPYSTPHANANDNPKPEEVVETIEEENPARWSLGWIP